MHTSDHQLKLAGRNPVTHHGMIFKLLTHVLTQRERWVIHRELRQTINVRHIGETGLWIKWKFAQGLAVTGIRHPSL